MTNKFFVLTVSTILGVLASQAHANIVVVSQLGVTGTPTRKVTVAEAAGGAPNNGDVYIFQVTTDSDILSVNQVAIRESDDVTPLASIYNHANGHPDNAEPGDPTFIVFVPALGADTWVSTPGATNRLGPNLPGDGLTTSFGDLTTPASPAGQHGPQAAFQFAQITVPEGTTGIFRGRISINDTTNPGTAFVTPFSLPIGIPEPATVAMGGMGLIALVGMGIRRRKA